MVELQLSTIEYFNLNFQDLMQFLFQELQIFSIFRMVLALEQNINLRFKQEMHLVIVIFLMKL
jgi:hypothetical protein